ncbi:MAG: peptidyl-prolyl cis-trans isomerase [Deltaproteobacteria bacterium]|nr:peptidyl-prolyl cis-trans isomerase [Deltaproteobacteria bacterium]
MRLIKSGLIGFTFGLFLFCVSGCASSPEDERLFVVNVNGKVISYTQYRDALKRLLPSDRSYSAEELTELKKDLINELVEEELILQEAKRLKVFATEAEIGAEMEGIEKDYGDEPFKEAITERYGSIGKWKAEIERKLIIKKTIDNMASKVKIPEAAAKKYYEEHIKDYEKPEQVHAKMIVVSSYESARKIRAKVTRANFAKVAKDESLSPENKSGGDLGLFGRGEMPREFEEVVFKLKPGEISPVIKTEYGYHIFLVEQKIKGEKQKFGSARNKIVEKLKSDEADKVFTQWITNLKKNAKIDIKEELL